MHMTAIRNRIGRLREERGFTMMVALFVMVVTALLLGASYIALVNDSQLTRTNLDQQRALAAAQAGIASYTYQLNANPNYWEGCVAPTNQAVPGSTDSGSTEYYNDTPLIASTAATGTTCTSNTAVTYMIESSSSAADGTFRVSATGWSGPTSVSNVTNCTPSNNCVERTLVAQYRRESFLNFVYYTDYETLDPSVLYNPNNNPTEPTDCEVHYPGRGNDCGGAINFFTGDTISGPLHSEDTLAICGDGTSSDGPTFGRTSADTIQAAGLAVETNGCQLTEHMVGTYTTTAPSLTPPPSNSQLLDDAENGGYVCTGKTTIVLNGTTLSITNTDSQNNTTTYPCPTGSSEPYPSNGVIYVQSDSSGCSVIYTPFTADTAYTTDSSCGDALVSGDYSSSLTIASGNDIVVDGNIYPNTVSLAGNPSTPPTPTGDALLGLVAQAFVRVYHQVTGRSGSTSGNCGNGSSNGTSYSDLYIYAAILAVSHSFIVDNYDCGSPLGTLHIYGALAQLFRGTVATGSATTISTGYAKDYVYDDRLASLEPPYFLNPVDSAWYVQRQTECDVASSC
jgi:Tfp pilus assembly protein PilX